MSQLFLDLTLDLDHIIQPKLSLSIWKLDLRAAHRNRSIQLYNHTVLGPIPYLSAQTFLLSNSRTSMGHIL